MRRLGQFTVASDHPCLPGHFAGRPIVPGVLLLDAMMDAIRETWPGRVAEIGQAKFLQPVQPGQDVTLSARTTPDGRIAFAAGVDGQDVLRGMVRLEAVP